MYLKIGQRTDIRAKIAYRKDDCRLYCCIVPTVKQRRASELVWGCFSFAGTGDLRRIMGVMKKENYLNILEENAIPSELRLIGQNFTFMHDNDLKYSAVLCRNYLQEQQDVLKVMTWHPQSPDLTPIVVVG